MYSSEVKQQVLQMIKEGKSVSEIGKLTNISLPTIYKWKKENTEILTDNKDIENTPEDEKVSIAQLSRQLRILIEEGSYSKALDICEQHKTNPNIQSQHVKILFELGLDEEALELCEKFKNNSNVQMQHILMLAKMEKYEEAFSICDLPQFLNNPFIQEHKAKLIFKKL